MIEFTAAARWCHLIAATVLFGASLFRHYALRTETPERDAFDHWLHRVLLASAALAFATALVWWDSLTVSMSRQWSNALSGEMLSVVLFETQFGKVWVWRMAVNVIVAILAVYVTPARPAAFKILTGLTAILLASLALVGHGTMDHAGGSGVIHGVSDAVHLLCAGAWLGGLLSLAYILARARTAAVWRALAQHAIPLFSNVGYGAVVLLALTGIANAIFIADPAGLLTTPYGYVLIAKVCLFALMVTLAIYNRYRLAPRIIAPAGSSVVAASLMWTSAIELTIGIAILGLVGLLGVFPPPHLH